MFFYLMIFCNKIVFILYIFGVCMYFDYCVKGVMWELLLQSFVCMFCNGVLFSILIFVEFWLFGYYVKIGYIFVFCIFYKVFLFLELIIGLELDIMIEEMMEY